MKIPALYPITRQEILHAEAILHMLKTFTRDDRYGKIEADIMEQIRKGVPITMCEFAERMERQGIEKGIEKGEARFAELSEQLLKASRTEDLLRATTDKEFRDTLYLEYNL